MAIDSAKDGAIEIVRRLHLRGFRALLSGGCVRDFVLGQKPKDYDIATDADPDAVSSIFPDALKIGAHFGVVLVRLGDWAYEVARFRRDIGYSDGRHPDSIIFSNEKEDAFRRDFTVNGMFYDPLTDKIIDYVGGQDDLRQKIIRTIGSPETRFREDWLRMLRAIRFGCRYGWNIEAKTFRAIRSQSSMISEVSLDRIRDELVKILTEGGAPLGLRWLIDLGLMEKIIPEVLEMQGVAQPVEYHPEGDVLMHTLILLGLMQRPSVELAMGGLLHDVGKPRTFQVSDRIRFNNHDRIGAAMAEVICSRLRFSAEQVCHIVRLVSDHHQFVNVQQMRPSRLKRFLRTQRFDDHLELHRIDCLSSHGRLDCYEFCRQALKDYCPEEISPVLLITGHDLIRLGYSPSPAFKVVIAAVEDAQLEGTVVEQEGAIALVQDTFNRLGIISEHSKENKIVNREIR